jgi:hypothetical protein
LLNYQQLVLAPEDNSDDSCSEPPGVFPPGPLDDISVEEEETRTIAPRVTRQQTAEAKRAATVVFRTPTPSPPPVQQAQQQFQNQFDSFVSPINNRAHTVGRNERRMSAFNPATHSSPIPPQKFTERWVQMAKSLWSPKRSDRSVRRQLDMTGQPQQNSWSEPRPSRSERRQQPMTTLIQGTEEDRQRIAMQATENRIRRQTTLELQRQLQQKGKKLKAGTVFNVPLDKLTIPPGGRIIGRVTTGAIPKTGRNLQPVAEAAEPVATPAARKSTRTKITPQKLKDFETEQSRKLDKAKKEAEAAEKNAKKARNHANAVEIEVAEALEKMSFHSTPDSSWEKTGRRRWRRKSDDSSSQDSPLATPIQSVSPRPQKPAGATPKRSPSQQTFSPSQQQRQQQNATPRRTPPKLNISPQIDKGGSNSSGEATNSPVQK